MPVNIYVNFVSARAGVDPKLRIDNPTNLSYELETIYPNDFDNLLDELDLYIKDEETSERFHLDTKHNYTIDGRAWQHGTAIYGRRSIEAGEKDGVVTIIHTNSGSGYNMK